MADLKKLLESLGFAKVRTLLNSGNVVFEADELPEEKITSVLERSLKGKFGFDVPVLIRTLQDLQILMKRDPFRGINITPETRLYLSFLFEKPESKLRLPYQSPERTYKILSCSTREVLSVLTLSPNTQSIDLMSILEKEFGKKITTRNWNTIEKILMK